MNAQLFTATQSVLGLPTLTPSPAVDAAFRALVGSVCESECEDSGIDKVLAARVRAVAAEAETHMEYAAASRIANAPDSRAELAGFQYYDNYRQLSRREWLTIEGVLGVAPRRMTVVGAGPLPLTSYWYGRYGAEVTSYDCDHEAVQCGSELLRTVAPGDPHRYYYGDARSISPAPDCDAVVLAALVGDNTQEKADMLRSLASTMREGSVVLIRSAIGARTLLYPQLDSASVDWGSMRLRHVMSVHPRDEIINSWEVFRVCD